MGKQASKQSKRLFLINRDFQIRHTRSAIVVGLVSTILTAIVILYPLYFFQILRIPRFLPAPILLAMALAAVLNIVIVGVMGIFVTHRIAGPMYSLVRSFRKVSIGKYEASMGFRADDELKFVVRNFNNMIEALRGFAVQDIKMINKTIILVESLEKAEEIEKIRSELGELKKSIESRLEE